ncbi:MAG TPA: ISL3 family transposase [Clostridiaceae bacterium]|nr:ISL3 family transposase [Clostridiaceae bacterium]
MTDHKLLEKMLDLPEFKITDLKHNEHDIRIYIEKKEKPSVCPSCGIMKPKLRVHSKREQEVRDKNIQGKRVGLIFKRIRYKCMECGATFYELSDSIAPKSRLTNRLRDYIAEESKRRSFIDLERELDISNVTIREIFLEEVKKLECGLDIETPSIIGIDEIHIQREGKHRKQAWALICNGDDHTVMDLLPDRNKSTIIEYFNNLKNPYSVQVVTMDMWEPYRDAVYQTLPNAKIVIDKFHVVKMANDALNTLRKSFKNRLGKKKNKSLKQERYLLLKREHDLKPLPDIAFRDAWFNEIPELKVAYDLKESLFKIYDASTKSEAKMLYNKWKASIPDDMSEFREVAKTIDNWYTEIFNYFDYKVTNAFVEGINSTIRAIESQGRGYTFEVLRAKVMFFINHKVDKPSYGSGTFSNILMSGFNLINETKDYGVPFENIIKAINEGLL